ncbi:hypothetical protein GCM10022280_06810 [Sphingomonas swuensis]|uniref:TonB C-terminal domain-containing protein n=1 Tax=Sphingomonas swuensis TaxID=977800 RepID=A0ABP7SH77_9SPHN
MQRRPLATPADRARSAVIVAAVHVALGYALLTGLGVTPVPTLPEPPLPLFDLAPEPEPEPPAIPMVPEKAPTPTERPKDPEGAAAPPALKNTPTEVVAPPPKVELPVPPPLPASPIAGTGSAASPGAAEVPGPGTGRGGVGDGLGSGRSGTGTGGGGGGGLPASGPFYRSGEIEIRDAPPRLVLDRSRRVGFRLLVGRDGRTLDCQITASSGIGELDDATCAAARRRLRWRPAIDSAGRVVEAWAPGNFVWHPAPLAEEYRD